MVYRKKPPSATSLYPQMNNPTPHMKNDQLPSDMTMQTVGTPLLGSDKATINIQSLNVYYGDKQVIFSVSLDIRRNEVIAMIGASGCGKSTFLRCFNRMNDIVEDCRVEGSILMDGKDVNSAQTDVVALRQQVGMVFQKPNPFPKTIYDNIAYGPRIHGLAATKSDLDGIVEECLQRVGLWDEVKDRMHQLAPTLSGGQQQRLCIARTISVNPDVILMDEPCSALDPIATAKVENLITELSANYTIAIVTHSMQQAARISDRVAYFYLGRLVEVNSSDKIFTTPDHHLTESYITGRFG